MDKEFGINVDIRNEQAMSPYFSYTYMDECLSDEGKNSQKGTKLKINGM